VFSYSYVSFGKYTHVKGMPLASQLTTVLSLYLRSPHQIHFRTIYIGVLLSIGTICTARLLSAKVATHISLTQIVCPLE
jgi:hypothetical protein